MPEITPKTDSKNDAKMIPKQPPKDAKEWAWQTHLFRQNQPTNYTKSHRFFDLVFLTSWAEFATPETPKRQFRVGETLVFKNNANCVCSPFWLQLGPKPAIKNDQNWPQNDARIHSEN